MADDVLISSATPGLKNLKYEVASELGYGNIVEQPNVTPQNFGHITNNMKYEFADQLGISSEIKQGYWGNVSSRDCGAVGGRIGGKIGGSMVARMIQYAEQNMLK